MKIRKIEVYYKDAYYGLKMHEVLTKRKISHDYIAGLIVIRNEETEFMGIDIIGVHVKIKDVNIMFTKEHIDMDELYIV